MEICGLEHLYSDRTCVLPAEHDSYLGGWTSHQAADGYRWWRREETYAEGTEDEGVEEWDEPVDEPSGGPLSITRVALLDDVGIQTHGEMIPFQLRAGDSVKFVVRLIL